MLVGFRVSLYELLPPRCQFQNCGIPGHCYRINQIRPVIDTSSKVCLCKARRDGTESEMCWPRREKRFANPRRSVTLVDAEEKLRWRLHVIGSVESAQFAKKLEACRPKLRRVMPRTVDRFVGLVQTVTILLEVLWTPHFCRCTPNAAHFYGTPTLCL